MISNFFCPNQVIVLTRIIPDEDQALTSATGIKILIDLLQHSKDDAILSLAADCVARLAHTRAGEGRLHNDWQMFVQISFKI